MSSIDERPSPLQRLPFGLKINGGIAIGCFNARVAQPVTDGYKINTSTQEVNCRAVPPMSLTT